MKAQTENAVRGLLALDDEIDPADIEAAIVVLRGGTPIPDEEVMTRGQVAKLLKKHPRTVDWYVRAGRLDRVYGPGLRGIGITRSSFLRFIRRRVGK